MHDHVHDNGRLGEGGKNPGGGAGLIGDVGDNDLGLVLINGDAANDDFFHVGDFFFHDGSGVVVKGGADFENDVIFVCELNGTRLHDLGAGRGQLEHLVVGDFLEFAGVFHDSGIGGVNAVNVSVDLALVGLECASECDGSEIGAAAAQGGNAAVGGDALKTGDDDDLAGGEVGLDIGGVDALDLGLGVDIVGNDAGLRTSVGNGGHAETVKGHGGEGDGLLFADGEELVHLALVGIIAHGFGAGDELVGDTGAGGDDDDDLVAVFAVTLDAGGDFFNAFDVTDGSAAVFLDDSGHGF